MAEDHWRLICCFLFCGFHHRSLPEHGAIHARIALHNRIGRGIAACQSTEPFMHLLIPGLISLLMVFAYSIRNIWKDWP